ncbi:MAG: cytochrome c oxidase subunit 3 [Candidatus Omnitrophica bacterium]|nr:cytochrome c oxidase subunit 3 [Candidatus Omnitrophota bacterium]
MSQAASVEHSVGQLGIEDGKLGMWVFLASEVMFFVGLLSTYIVLKAGHPAWPGPQGHLSVPLGTLNTLILILSSMTMALSVAAVSTRNAGALRLYLLATIVLGSVFLGIKSIEYSAKFHHEIFPSTSVFWSCYFVLTGVHALHVIVGVGVNAWVLSKTWDGNFWTSKSHRVELSGLYWHFVDVVWIFLFPLLYLL